MKYYAAYGSNLNMEQMRTRCAGAKFIGTTMLLDYELQFKGYHDGVYLTIAPQTGAFTPIGLWEIDASHENSLDLYEDHPWHYFKQDVTVFLAGREVTAMVYIMNLEAKFGIPSDRYYRGVENGYRDCGLDPSFLQKARMRSTLAAEKGEPLFIL